MKILYALLFLTTLSLHAETSPEHDVAKISEAMGHLIGKNLQALGLDLDLSAVVKGLQDGADGKHSPLSEDECVQAIAVLQEENFSAVAAQNRMEADDFLKANRKKDGVVSLEDGKLQYKILKDGFGQAVEPYNSPIVRYTARYLNGEIFGSAPDDELISLDETIPGFRKGLVGMKEGETRTLYLHPDLAYGKQSPLLPNALIIFEVEIVKADGSADVHAAANMQDISPQMLESLIETDSSIQ
ncbi:MAG: FKBP-type peptidyl-prolyl cis-trans isomerase [Chlamydiae bacterium]|nr:FKBP-type peptidyl-prolyl cis-trans isomerase [Chlamydiota bacterium]